MFDIQLNDNRILIKSLKQEITDTQIYTISPWDNTPKESIKHTFRGANTWVIFPFEIKNRSKLVVKNGDEYHSFILPLNKEKISKKKIICVGLNKTGTTSLAKGLESLGLKGYPENIGHQFLTHSVLNNSVGSTISAIEDVQYDFYEDIPFSFPELYKKLFKYFPNEKYILTVRNNSEEWIDSCIKFYGDAINTERINLFDNNVPYLHSYCGIVTHKVYNWGHPMFKSWKLYNTENLRDKLKFIYEKHLDEFVDFMNKNSGDYMIVNVSKEGELRKVSKWLGIETNNINFGHFNKTT